MSRKVVGIGGMVFGSMILLLSVFMFSWCSAFRPLQSLSVENKDTALAIAIGSIDKEGGEIKSFDYQAGKVVAIISNSQTCGFTDSECNNARYLTNFQYGQNNTVDVVFVSCEVYDRGKITTTSSGSTYEYPDRRWRQRTDNCSDVWLRNRLIQNMSTIKDDPSKLEACMKKFLSLNVNENTKVKTAGIINDNTHVATSAPSVTVFTDSRDGKTYKKVTINSQTWMGENLNYAAEGSKCYENLAENCAKYGRLYDWDAAQKACPAGFHLPNDDEWKTLVDYAVGEELEWAELTVLGGSSKAGTKLTSTSGWNSDDFDGESRNGTDDLGFSALPGGGEYGSGYFNDAGSFGKWWSATDSNTESASFWLIGGNMHMNNDGKTRLFSVRCVAD